MIRDTSNKNLIYIWVPLKYEDLDSVKSQLWDNIYQKYKNENGEKFSKDTELYNIIKKSSDENVSSFKNSIKKYNGFYISQAELSKNSNKEYVNVSRGMVDYSVSKTIGGGDYVRGSNIKTNIYKNMKNIAEKSNENVSVTSHLMYGIEYDAALLWIAETNQDYVDKENLDIYTIICANSTNVGKYSNSGLGANASASAVKSFNGIWGLGGNLLEVTQEHYDNKNVLRGGSYQDTGEHAPIASRKIVSNLESTNIGFRTALYINTDCETTETENNTFKYKPNDDTIETINKIEFKLWAGTPRYVNSWDGLKVYKLPAENSTVIKVLNMAEEVIVTAKAVNKIENKDGTKLTWARIKLNSGEDGYVRAEQLTDSIAFFGDSIGFVMTSNPVVRYYKDNLRVYSYPNDENMLFDTAYLGQLEIIGKSTNQEWALYKVGNEDRFIRSKDLTVNIDKETIGNVTFIKGNEKNFWVIDKDTNLYSAPEETNTIKSIEYGTQVIVNAISSDGIWSRVKIDSNLEGYVLTSKLDTVQPVIENVPQEPNNDSNFKITNDVVYVTARNGLNIRSSCDTSTSSNIVTTIQYRWGINRIAAGNNGWDKLNIDGKECYAYNKYLSTTQPKLVEATAKSVSTKTTYSNDKSKTNNTSKKDATVSRPSLVTLIVTSSPIYR